MATTSSEMQNLLDSPAMAAPPGLKHNFVNPPSLNTVLCVDFSVCFIVSAVAVVIRMWTKVRLIRKVEIEDCKDSTFGPPLPLCGHPWKENRS